MADPIFERYKEALKAGHLAVLRGQTGEAIEHYREAAEIAPERPLPHTSLGGVLLREGRLDDALAAYARALGRAPRDEAALAGRAEALIAADRPAEAAEVLERLAEVQAATIRTPEALATLHRAEALQSTRARRRRIKELTAELAPPRAVPARRRLTARLPKPPGRPRRRKAPAEGTAPAEAAVGAIAPGPAEPVEVADVAPPPPDPEALLRSADELLDAGRADEAAEAYTAAAAAFQLAGEAAAAFDACQRGLEAAPGAAVVHVALARLYLARGWRDRAAEKLVLLDRLMRVTGDEGGHGLAVELARSELPDEPPVAAWLAALDAEPAAAEARPASIDGGTVAPP